MKFGQSIGYNKRNIFLQKNITREIFFFKNYAEKEARRLVPHLVLIFKNA